MTWTYGGDPSANDRDWVRWRVGDTDTTDQLQSDEEIDAALAEYGSKYAAAAAVARAIAGSFARRVDSTMGKLSLKWSQLADAYTSLGADIEAEAAASLNVAPWAASISVSEKDAQEGDTDRVPGSFARGQFMVNDESTRNDGSAYGR